MDQDDEEWNPSWSDEDNEEEEKNFSVPVPSNSKGIQIKNNYRNKEYGESTAASHEGVTDKETQRNSKYGHTEKSSQDNLSDANLFRRKFYNKEELFRNLAGRQSKDENNPENSVDVDTSVSKTVESMLPLTTKTVPVKSISDELKCNECGKQFDKRIHLTLHQKIHARMDKSHQLEDTQDGYQYQCSTCDQHFETNKDLISHNEKKHSKSQTNIKSVDLVCEKCDRKFDRSNQLNFHKKLCKAVPKKTSQPVKQSREEAFNRSSKLVDLTCEKCDRKFDTSNQLKLHTSMCRVVLKNTLKETSHSVKQNYEETCNLKSLDFVCDKCDRRFERGIQLKLHRKLCKEIFKKVFGTEKAPYLVNQDQTKCEDGNSSVDRNVCDTFVRTKFLDTGYEGQKQFKSENLSMSNHSKVCSRCNLLFHETEFEKHFQSCAFVTKKINPTFSVPTKIGIDCLKCSDCAKSFNNQVALRQHHILHEYSIESFEDISSTDLDYVLPFACQQVDCKSRFSNEFDLDFHREKKHNICTFSNPVFYHIQDSQLPPLNPYVLLTHDVKEPADTKWMSFLQARKDDTSTNLTPRVIKRRFKKLRGRQPRLDIPFQNFYICGTCNRKFNKRRLYLIHISGHKREEMYSCNLCERKFLSKSYLEAHIKRHSDPAYKSSNGRSGRRLREDIPVQDVYTCETCGEKFDQRNQFIIHLREEKFKCTLCDRGFQSAALLEGHIKRHSDPSYVPGQGRFRDDVPFQDVYTCETCGEKFEQRNLFLLHLREEKFKCTLCNRGFQAESVLKAHMERHLDPSYVPGRRRFRSDIPIQSVYKCDICEKSFKERNYFLIHIAQHKREDKFKCNICDRKFMSQTLLETHIERHSDPSYVPGQRRFRSDIPIQSVYKCDTCEKSFKERNYFLIHIAQHKREDKFKCNICERKFLSQTLLDAHIERHSDPSYVPGRRGRWHSRPDIPVQSVYSCSTCSMTFEDRQRYLSHISQHEREARLTCNICRRKYSTLLMLQSHMKRHLDPLFRPRRQRNSIPIQDVYTCEKCTRSFTDRQKYICHLHYHRNARPNPTGKRRPRRSDIPIQDIYFCEICSRQFKDRQKYIIHLYIHEKGGNGAIKKGRGSGRRRLDIPVQDIYYCEHCNYKKSFTDRIKYILHLRNHGLEKRHKCDGCLKLFKTTHARDNHREKFCKNIPCKFKCDRCGDRFHNKITLARHFQRFHSKIVESAEPEIEYPCNQCSQTFNTTFGLTRHNQVYHPGTDVTLEGELPHFAQNSADNDSSHSWDAEEDNPMLAVSFCEAELNEEEEAPEEKRSQIRTLRRNLPPGSTLCQCAVTRKYKTQKFCHSKRCQCVLRGNRCSKDCNCEVGCLNSNELEAEQQQKFKEGRESMMEMESPPHNDFDNEESHESTPIVVGYTEESKSYPITQPKPSTSSLGYNKLITSSEFIAVGDSQDESMRQLSLEGYVEGAEDFGDPLGDPLQEEPQVQLGNSFSLAETSVIEQPQGMQTSSFPSATVSQTPPNSSSSSLASSGWSNRKNKAETSADSFNQSANLRCQFCKKNFKVIPVYISHILNHNLEKDSLLCPICLKDFAHEVTSYCQHLNIHNKGINLQCTKCSSKFQSYNDMEKHLKVHHFRPMECGLCVQKFPNSQLMMSHWSRAHPTCQCGLCNLKFFSYDDLTFHMKSLHSPYDCIRCNERFENLEELLSHYTKQHYTTIFPGQMSQNGFKCTYCSDSFSNGEDLNEHLSNHLIDQQNTTHRENLHPTNLYQCHQCPTIAFTTAEDLHDHLSQHLLGSTTTIVPQNSSSHTLSINNCSTSSSNGAYKRFLSSTCETEVEEIQQDVINDNIQAVETFTCPKCGKGFQSRNGWRLHLTTHKLVICSACDSFFETKEELMSHLQVTSCSVLFCDVCDRNFQAKKYLSQHKKFVHERDKKSSTTKRKQSFTLTTDNDTELVSGYSYTNSTGLDSQIEDEDSFPVIVASTSLAQRYSSPAQPASTCNINIAPPQRFMSRTQPQVQGSLQREIEEIVLD